LQRPLHYAARANRVDLLDVLLSCGSTIDGLDESDRTPLHVAVEEQALDSVRYLLDQGASMVRADSKLKVLLSESV
jgi:ankyrin repeat protein